MQRRFYLDTCIWRDYYENRTDNFRPLGEWALSLIQKILEEKNRLLYSDIIIDELRILYSLTEISEIFEIVAQHQTLIKVPISQSQKKEAALLCKERKMSWADALHAILARDHNAILVSRDKHFLQLGDIAEIRKPEELI